jgi:hypothetical protein
MDENGRLYRETPLTAPGLRSGLSGQTWKGVDPSSIGKGRHWAIPSFVKENLSDEALNNTIKALDELDSTGRIKWAKEGAGQPNIIQYSDDLEGVELQSIWTDFSALAGNSTEAESYPTQKPEALLERIIKASSNEGDLVFDCFMGSGTTQAVAMKLGRRFIGADINLGAVQITTKRLLGVAEELEQKKNSAKSLQLSIPKVSPKLRAIEGGKASEPVITKRAAEKGTDYVTSQNIEPSDESVKEIQTDEITTYYTGFEVYNVNHYDVFRNPLEAKDLLLEALEIQRLDQGNLFDGEKDRRMVKIMPVNRIATKADLSEIIAGLDYKKFERLQKDSKHKPTEPLEKITLVCMGHEPDLRDLRENKIPIN